MNRLGKGLIGMGVLLALASVAPALADTTSVPPGNPCFKDNGNPCNDNNGNQGHQGNVNKEHVVIGPPGPINISMPPVSDRGVFINQIGDNNVANVVQTAPNAYAAVDQNGNSNDAELTQSGAGTGYIAAAQTGDQNFARLEQSGSGQNVVYATQTGTGNWMWSNQAALGAIYNGAQLSQNGNYNDMQLDQEGSDNLAVLDQEGDNNGMTATQLGEGNRLIWTQQGDYLSDLQVTQTGGDQSGGQMMITQSYVANGNGH
jgi:Curlin associated repeat